MHILSIQPFGREELLDALRETKLVGFGQAPVYAHATLKLEPAQNTDRMVPAQRYVLRNGVAKILELRLALLDAGVDIFALEGGVYVRTSEAPDRLTPIIPPIVEESHESDGQSIMIINDGIHRVFAARSLGLPISIVAVYEVPSAYPYYALPLEHSWADVVEIDELPEEFVKKTYRDQTNYRALFRDFNAEFPGVQAARTRSNPAHLIREQ
jgi:hypothetical protein